MHKGLMGQPVHKKQAIWYTGTFVVCVILYLVYVSFMSENVDLSEKYPVLSLVDALVTFLQLLSAVLLLFAFVWVSRWVSLIKRSDTYKHGTAVPKTLYNVGVGQYVFVVFFCSDGGSSKKMRMDKLFTAHGRMCIENGRTKPLRRLTTATRTASW